MRGAAILWHVVTQFLGRAVHNAARVLRGMREFCCAINVNTTFKHCDVMPWMHPRKGQIGPSGCLKRSQGRWLTIAAGMFHQISKNAIPLKRGFGDQIFATFEMAINGGRGDARAFCSLKQGKARWTLFTDQHKGRFYQRLFQVAVMIPAFRHSTNLPCHISIRQSYQSKYHFDPYSQTVIIWFASRPIGRGVCHRRAQHAMGCDQNLFYSKFHQLHRNRHPSDLNPQHQSTKFSNILADCVHVP